MTNIHKRSSSVFSEVVNTHTRQKKKKKKTSPTAHNLKELTSFLEEEQTRKEGTHWPTLLPEHFVLLRYERNKLT